MSHDGPLSQGGRPPPCPQPPAGRATAPGAVRLATLSARLAAEMDALAELATMLDARMGALLEGGALRDPRYGIQDLDLLRQIAVDLATVQRRLADSVPQDVAVPVDPLVVRLQLAALAHRLRTGQHDDTDSGNGVEFF